MFGQGWNGVGLYIPIGSCGGGCALLIGSIFLFIIAIAILMVTARLFGG